MDTVWLDPPLSLTKKLEYFFTSRIGPMYSKNDDQNFDISFPMYLLKAISDPLEATSHEERCTGTIEIAPPYYFPFWQNL